MTLVDILTPDWLTLVIDAAREDSSFRAVSRALTADLYLHDERRGVSVRFENGEVLSIVDEPAGAVRAPVIEVSGSHEQWRLALAGAPDLAATAQSRYGDLTVQGDHIHRAGNALALKHLWLAMRRVGGIDVARPVSTAGPPSPSEEIMGRYIQVEGFRVYYESLGSGHPVVCIHTGGADGREYRHLLPNLASVGYQVIAVDLPGHGKTYPDLESLALLSTADDWIDFVLAFSKALGLHRPVYIGCAMSGSVLLELAARYPDAASAIVAANGNAENVGGIGDDFLDVLNHPQVNVGNYMESITDGLLAGTTSSTTRNECVWQNARNLASEVMHADLAIYNRHDVRQTLNQIRIPVLHLRGQEDPTVNDENAVAIRDSISNVTAVTLPLAGHFPMLENPVGFNREVERFLASVPF